MRQAMSAAIALLLSASSALGCGSERWPVKTGADRDAARVANSPKPATIAQLGSIAAPAHPERLPTSRFAPTELTTFHVTGVLTVIEREADGDYHIVLADPVDPRVTMIVEGPDPGVPLERGT